MPGAARPQSEAGGVASATGGLSASPVPEAWQIAEDDARARSAARPSTAVRSALGQPRCRSKQSEGCGPVRTRGRCASFRAPSVTAAGTRRYRRLADSSVTAAAASTRPMTAKASLTHHQDVAPDDVADGDEHARATCPVVGAATGDGSPEKFISEA
jgi:hypothetical protein